MKNLLAVGFITLLALGMGCAWISPASETNNEGIKVHGHWTVTVTNPDGTLDAVHEFENALSPSAGEVLTAILIGESDVTEWYIKFWLTKPIECLQGGDLNETNQQMTLRKANTIENTVTAVRDKTISGTPIRISASCDVIATTPSEITKVLSNVVVSPLVDKNSGKFHSGPLTTTGAGLAPIEIHNGQKISLNIEVTFD